MESLGGEELGQRVSMRTVALGSLLGAVLEWYDFLLFNTAAALVLGPLFFPSANPLVGTLAAFATYGAGFVARPIGGVVFGHVGDKVGRKAALVATMLLIGGATFLIGLLPTYASIGVLAPILLVTLRLIQGFGFGGEFGGAALLVVEHAPRNQRGFWGAIPQVGVGAGFVLSTGILLTLSALLSEEQFLSWGWRVPFLISILLMLAGLFVRLRILETPAFAQVKETGTEARIPIFDLLRTYPKTILLLLGARLADTTSGQIFQAVTIAYVTAQLGLPNTVALTGIFVGSAVGIVVIPIFGAISDRVGRRPLYMLGAVGVGLLAFPYFVLLDTGTPLLIWLAITLGVIVNGLMFSVQSSYFTELFGPRVRYSGLSLAFQLSAVAGGFTPFIATALLAGAGGNPRPVSIFLIVVAVVSLVCLLLLTETFRGDVAEAEERLQESQTAVADKA